LLSTSMMALALSVVLTRLTPGQQGQTIDWSVSTDWGQVRGSEGPRSRVMRDRKTTNS
jgi:hypothetical protein